MTIFASILLSNIVFASLLAGIAFVITRVGRQPQLAHALWLLVLVKLITPPLFEVPLPTFLDSSRNVLEQVGILPVESDSRSAETTLPLPEETFIAEVPEEERFHSSMNVVLKETVGEGFELRWYHLILGSWLLGTLFFACWTLRRHWRFTRVVAESRPSGRALRERVRHLAHLMGLRSYPQLHLTETHVCPLVTGGWGRQIILLPSRLVEELKEDQIDSLLAHEIAHLCRRDHLVRYFELFVLAVYWWNPLAWWASRHLRQAQEECCDAWVAWVLPAGRRAYGLTLLQTVEFLTEKELVPSVTGASFGNGFLARRIDMIMNQDINRSMSPANILFFLLVCALVLPAAFGRATADAQVSGVDGAESVELIADTQPQETHQGVENNQSTSEFPYEVKFEQGATRFEKRDDITIQSIRGTAETFVPGHLYVIRGTYRLASQDEALLAAYTTATQDAEGRTRPLRVQHLKVKKGEGTFKLILPMKYEGYPHVSFYGNDGNGIGGNYFGTDEYVLKEWFDTKKVQARKEPKPAPLMELSDREQTVLASKGYRMSSEEAEELEAKVDANPYDLKSRIQLLGFYDRHGLRSHEMQVKHENLVLWLIENYPASAAAGAIQLRIFPALNPDGYVEAKKLWLDLVEDDSQNVAVLQNAAEFLLFSDRVLSEELLLKAQALEPNNASVANQLGSLYKLGLSRLNGEERSERADKSIAQFELVLSQTKERSRYRLLSNLAATALHGEMFEKAEDYANQLLETGDQGVAVHVGNIVLGRLALRNGNIEEAKAYLLKAGRTQGAPNLNTFGPDMVLAKKLLEKGEREVVLEYFDLCGRFWKKKDQLQEWTAEVKRGGTPNWAPNLRY